MVLGYDEPRPTKGQYKDFLEKLIAGLEGLEGLSLMLYGSYARGDWVPGRSDIDAVLVFPEDVVIDKKQLHVASKALAHALDGNPIPFQVTPTDLTTMTDGRFNSYNPTFEPYFRQERQVVVGPDYFDRFRFEMPHHPEQQPLTFNLRKSRQGLLFAEHYQTSNYVTFLTKFKSMLDAFTRGSKQVLFMYDDHLRLNRFSALSELPTTFPEVDLEPLRRMQHLYDHLDELDALYRQPEKVVKTWQESLTFFEELVRAYISKVPNSQK